MVGGEEAEGGAGEAQRHREEPDAAEGAAQEARRSGGDHDERRYQDDPHRLHPHHDHERGHGEQQVLEGGHRHAGERGELGVEGRVGEPGADPEEHRDHERRDRQDHPERLGRDREQASEEEAFDVDRGRARRAQAEEEDPGGEGDGEEDAGRHVAPEGGAPPHVLDAEGDRDGERQSHPDRPVHGGPEEDSEGEPAERRVGEPVGEETQAALDDEYAEKRPRRAEGEAGPEGTAHEALRERGEEGVEDLAHHSSSQSG